jgi:hypothetical protein
VRLWGVFATSEAGRDGTVEVDVAAAARGRFCDNRDADDVENVRANRVAVAKCLLMVEV